MLIHARPCASWPRPCARWPLQDHRADPGREWRRQGAGQPCAARHRPARERSLRGRELRGNPRGLLESELFGHVKRSVHRRVDRQAGLCSGGPAAARLFLDEVGELPAPVQVKLLRVLQEGKLRRVGRARTSPRSTCAWWRLPHAHSTRWSRRARFAATCTTGSM